MQYDQQFFNILSNNINSNNMHNNIIPFMFGFNSSFDNPNNNNLFNSYNNNISNSNNNLGINLNNNIQNDRNINNINNNQKIAKSQNNNNKNKNNKNEKKILNSSAMTLNQKMLRMMLKQNIYILKTMGKNFDIFNPNILRKVLLAIIIVMIVNVKQEAKFN